MWHYKMISLRADFDELLADGIGAEGAHDGLWRGRSGCRRESHTSRR